MKHLKYMGTGLLCITALLLICALVAILTFGFIVLIAKNFFFMFWTALSIGALIFAYKVGKEFIIEWEREKK